MCGHLLCAGPVYISSYKLENLSEVIREVSEMNNDNNMIM